MPVVVRNLTLSPGEPEEKLRGQVASRYNLPPEDILSLTVIRRGIDARKKPRVKVVYSVRLVLRDEERFLRRYGGADVAAEEPRRGRSFPAIPQPGDGIVIVGAGPAGLFCALRLSEYGLTATLLERGDDVRGRLQRVQRFWSEGLLDPESNVQFGEGGAGTFSDGKLTTRVKDPEVEYVLRQLVAFGAPADIMVAAKPHIGTDLLRGVVVALREHLQRSGFHVRFRSRLTSIAAAAGRVSGAVVGDADEIACGMLVLAPGHSSRDTYEMLQRSGVALEAKPFAIGVRVEHPQELIDSIQYGRGHSAALPPADYAVTFNDAVSGRSAYSFCMCPGGVVVASSSEAGGVVTNGMSLSRRNAPCANSALVVNVRPDDFGGSGPLAGIEFQRKWEHRAFAAGGGGYAAPAQNLISFLGGKGGQCRSSYRPTVRETDLAEVLPPYVAETLRSGIRHFDSRMKGFITADATLTGVETRTSAPVRIVRGEDLQSVTLKGLYPAGEGAGYAGGIVSAALDGIRVADAIAARLQSKRSMQ
ncbi:MAG TPA: FAD-binding protein [Verrucomicrobiae bacterium]|nr:FAD-binding protein [Verrucomicrobiae bacterium]